MSRGGPSHLGTLSTANSATSGRLRLQHQFLPSHPHPTQHYQQQQQIPQHTLRFDGKKSHNNQQQSGKSLYATGTIANAPRFNQNSYEVSPSSFRYYSSSVEYLAGD